MFKTIELLDMDKQRKLYISIDGETLQLESNDPQLDDFLIDLTDVRLRRRLLEALIEYEIRQGGMGWLVKKALLHDWPSGGER